DFLFTADRERAKIVDLGHRRHIDLALELPASPLEAVMSNEVWEEIYDRIAELVRAHRTTLVFVNTRRLSERVAKHLSDRLGKEAVTSHHGSLSRDQRFEAERRLKAGELRALVATASLELGIDIGSVDLVCQLGSTRSIATLLQRVGRSGHAVGATPKGRLFPLSRDELVEAIALVRATARGELDRLVVPERPLDILAQQIVAAVAAEDWSELELFDLVRGAWPFRDLSRETFDEVVGMLREGFAGRTGRRGAYLHHDRVNGRLRARRGARLAAITNGGAIPDTADYDVVLEPGEIRVGTVNEDFAIESMAGNIFQLGNTSWRILKIEPGKVRVEDARGAPPTIPFWLGEAPARTEELSRAVSDLRGEVSQRLAAASGGAAGSAVATVTAWLTSIPGVGEAAARQAIEYLAASERALGIMPTQEALALERFFDESGGMQLVLHSPYGSRLNRAWGLALRKRFCRKFNFELQASATEDAIVLSLGVTHSFPLEEVYSYLNPETVREVLIQALLDAPVWGVRWRWNATRALAVLRQRGGRRVPPQIQRMNADDLVSVVFPDQLACPENLAGDREVPDHPLVDQTLTDCLEEAMDLPHLENLLRRMRAGELTLFARDVAEPSPLAHESLNARPYAFLDDAPLEERRTQAVMSRRWLDPDTASDLGALDAAAIDAVRAEVWPQAQSADELHEALVLAGFLTDDEIATAIDPATGGSALVDELVAEHRVTRLHGGARGVWVAAERLAQLRAVKPDWTDQPALDLPAALRETWTAEDALVELVRNRLEILGPVTVDALADSLEIHPGAVSVALVRLEGQGYALRGRFTPRLGIEEWCERGLLARIHRRTLHRLRAEIEPVSTEAYLRFLLAWQHLADGERKAGPRGLEEVVAQLEGFEVAAGSWEVDVLPDRVEDYEREWLDALGNAGKVVWQRRTLPCAVRAKDMGAEAMVTTMAGASAGPVRATPIALLRRGHLGLWRRLAGTEQEALARLSPIARDVLAHLSRSGATFFEDIAAGTGLLHTQLEAVLGELTALGLVYSDSFLGLRALLLPAEKRKPISGPRRRRTADFGLEDAGRWVALADVPSAGDEATSGSAGADAARSSPEPPRNVALADEDLEEIARLLLRRWGVVFRRLLDREGSLPPWRDLLRVLRRLEARGEIRGGRFIHGWSGEQFALPEAVPTLRLHRRPPEHDQWIAVSGADPLNLVGILTPGARVPAISTNRVLYRNGRPAAVLLGRELRALDPLDEAELWEARKRLERRAPAAKAALAV
ncbi:MAG TPA: helicase-related protein, partial [Thermoanaerobaculia bacterium]|nr:helicase-related protein [Thermoanaerobaculia bacterium]